MIPFPSGAVPVTPLPLALEGAAADDLIVQLANGGVALLRAGSPGRHAHARRVRGRARRRVAHRRAPWSSTAMRRRGSRRTRRAGPRAAPGLRLGTCPGLHAGRAPAADLYPANVDALAVGPRGRPRRAARPLRQPSRPSALDPAVLVLPGVPAVPLAPWSTLLPGRRPRVQGRRRRVARDAAGHEPWLRLAGGAEVAGWRRLADAGARAVEHGARAVSKRWRCARPIRPCPGAPANSQFGSAWDQPVETWVVARSPAAPVRPPGASSSRRGPSCASRSSAPSGVPEPARNG